MAARDDEPGRPDTAASTGDGTRTPPAPAEAVPPDPPVGPGVPTRQDTDVPAQETPTRGAPDDPHDPPLGG